MLDSKVEFRIKEADKKAFIRGAKKRRMPYQVLLREMIKAFIEGRLRIDRKVKPIYTENDR